MNYIGEIDLTRLGQIAREHPNAIREVQFKDGVHKFLKVSVGDKKEPDRWGNVAYLKAVIKKAEQKENLTYFVADLKESQFNDTPQPAPQPRQAPQTDSDGDLPF